jgi:hypothetical protein
MDRIAEKGIAAKEAEFGERMLELKVRFWTNDIAEGKQIQPKHAWSGGVVRMAGNKSHSIVPGHPRPFNSLLDLGSAIEKVLIEHGIVLHHSDKAGKYMAERPGGPRPRTPKKP